MEHHEAIGSRAAEKYVAGELAPAQQDAFEDHFFDCQACAELVRRELVLSANVRAVLREKQGMRVRPGFWSAWRAWVRNRPALTFSFAANVILASALGAVLISGPRNAAGPRLLPAYFAPGTVRDSGNSQVHSIPPCIPAFLAHIPQPDQLYSSYSYEILGANGKRESAGVVGPPEEHDGDLYLEIPVRGLRDGDHTLEVRGTSGLEIISRSEFHTSGSKGGRSCQ